MSQSNDDSGYFTSTSETWSQTEGVTQATQGRCHDHPGIRQTENYRKALDISDDIHLRVLRVLDKLEEEKLNLTIFLWAISWNDSRLKSNMKAGFARTTLMHSEELGCILANWHQPPRQHNAGIRTKAAKQAMSNWAVDTVSDMIDDEIQALDSTLSLPKGDLSEEMLLGIKWQELIEDTQTAAPTMWKVFRNAAYTRKQEKRNSLKCPDAVCIPLQVSHH
jgi:hypothetical protein